MHSTQTWITSVSTTLPPSESNIFALSLITVVLVALCAQLELSQKGPNTKQAYAVTGEDGDSLKVYGGTKLLSPTNNGNSPGGGPRKRNKNSENQLIEGTAINTDSDSDMER